MYKIQVFRDEVGWSDICKPGAKSAFYFITLRRALEMKEYMFGTSDEFIRIVNTETKTVVYPKMKEGE